jgi:hypothetical protein
LVLQPNSPRLVGADDFIEAVETEGFSKIYEERFQTYRPASKGGKSVNVMANWECQYMFAHEDGMLLVCETRNGEMNKSSLYYNWLPNNVTYPEDLPSSRNKFDDVRRNAVPSIVTSSYRRPYRIRHTVRRMREYGKFINPWTEAILVDFCHSMDGVTVRPDSVAVEMTGGYLVTIRKRGLLPDWVKLMIGVAL